jgi:hypothetical protein
MDQRTEAAIDKGLARMSLSDISDWVGNLIAEQLTAVARRSEQDTRRDVAQAIKAQFLSTTNRATYLGKSPDHCIIEVLTEEPMVDKDNGKTVQPLVQDAKMRQLGVDFGQDGVSEDFRAGIRFALLLVGDLDYEL